MARRGAHLWEDACSSCAPATPAPAPHPKANGQLLLPATSAGPTESPDSPRDVWDSNWGQGGWEISHPFMMETNLTGLVEALVLLVLCLELYYHCCYYHHSPVRR